MVWAPAGSAAAVVSPYSTLTVVPWAPNTSVSSCILEEKSEINNYETSKKRERESPANRYQVKEQSSYSASKLIVVGSSDTINSTTFKVPIKIPNQQNRLQHALTSRKSEVKNEHLCTRWIRSANKNRAARTSNKTVQDQAVHTRRHQIYADRERETRARQRQATQSRAISGIAMGG